MQAAAVCPAQLEKSARAVMDRHAKSFSWAARFLSPAARREASLLYAFARTADDLADEASLGDMEQRTRALDMLCEQVMQRQPEASLPAVVGRMLENHQVPSTVLRHFTDSLRADMHGRRLQTQEQLLDFAYGVAGTVGLMMRPILGAPPSADGCAMALGVAMQLTNVARDVLEDAARGRVYVPLGFEVTAHALNDPHNEALRQRVFESIVQMLQTAEAWYAFAHGGVALIPAPNRRAVLVALELYRAIGRKIIRGGSAAYWRGRVHLNALEKIRLIVPLLVTGSSQPQSGRAPGAFAPLPRGFDALSGLPGFARD